MGIDAEPAIPRGTRQALGLREVAVRLGIARGTVKRWWAEGRIAAYLGLDLELVERRMAAGELSRTGFLADGQRLGHEIVRDAQELAALGVDHRDIAARMRLALALEQCIRRACWFGERGSRARIEPEDLVALLA